MAKKSRKSKSKKELEREGRTLGVELDRRHNKEDLIAELEEISPEEVSSESSKEVSSDVTWSSLEEFTEAVTASGLIYNGDFIPVNVPALYDAYTSNPTEFKQTAEYKFLTQ